MFIFKDLAALTRRGAPGAVLLLVPLFGACEEPTATPVAEDALREMQADAVMYGMQDYLTTEGVRSGLIEADTAYVYNDSSVVKMWGLDMTLFEEDGSQRARVTAERGTLHRRSEQMLAQGDVVLVVDQGRRRVESPELHYDPTNERIWSDSNSVYIENGRTTGGTCFRSDLDFQNLTVCNIRGNADFGRGESGGG